MTTSDPRMGEILRDGDRVGIRYVRRLQHPREKVWRALTRSDELRHWFPCDIVGERAAGATIQLPFWPDHVEAYGIDTPVISGRIHVWQPPAVFEWFWDTDHLRWELADDDGATVLTFTTWIGEPQAHGADGGSPDDATGTASAGAGYHTCLDYLERTLDGDRSRSLIDANTTGLEGAYRRRVDAAATSHT